MVLRGLLVAVVAIAITLVEYLLNYISDALSSPQANEVKLENNSDKNQFEAKNLSDQQIDYDFKSMTNAPQLSRYFYPILALISTVSFATGVAMITPIAKWAGSQVECVEKTLLEDQVDLQKSVKICNGGHE